MQDKILVCRDCGREFIFSVSEQAFFAEKGFANDPLRCLDCRAARRRKDRERGEGGGRQKEKYPAVCARCGAETIVPFKPSGDRPVYCWECFNKSNSYA
ncbi:MAG: zinc-ribbon domain containing protein [Peptococcaceae bacterium]|nr:zinc-ribbon domain containing protein [Peptococcaceae bacterium]